MPIVYDPDNLEAFKLHSIVDFTDKNVLEIGCGNGRLTELYHETTRSVTGIDLKFETLKIAAKDLPESHFAIADSVDLPLRNNCFDIAILAWSL